VDGGRYNRVRSQWTLIQGDGMNRKGPLLTLIAGLVLAGVLLAIVVNAVSRDRDRRGSGDASLHTGSAAPAGTYAARTTGAPGAVAIAVRDGKAVAYLSDGKNVDAWLQGSAANGAFSLTSPQGATLTGQFSGGKVTGSVSIQGMRWSFAAPSVAPPGGLYRTAPGAGGAITGGWIVMADGGQVGTVTVGGLHSAAPKLDPSTHLATVGGQQVAAVTVTGS
jgi:serine/threonine-protein kinase